MTPEEVIKTVLEPIAGLQDKVFPAEAIKNVSAPFVFYLQHREDEEETLDGPAGLMSADFEINCVAQTYAGLTGLVAAVRPALQSMQGVTYGNLLIERASVRQASPDLKEKEVNLYRRMLSLAIHYQKEEPKHE